MAIIGEADANALALMMIEERKGEDNGGRKRNN